MSLTNKTKEKMQKAFCRLKEFVIFLVKRAKSDTIMRVASSLSYTSLIALVPLFAIALAIFAAFPGFSDVRGQVQEFLLSSLAPNIENEIGQYFDKFVGATAKLSTFGVVGIAITSVMLLSTIENSLNFIFKVTKPRRFATKITLYWTVITLGPLLLGAAFSVRGYIFTLQNFVPEGFSGVGIYIGKMIPSLITVFVLMAVYILVPNKKVGFLSAFCGAVVCVVLFSVLRLGFAMFVLNSATYKTLYGALAILPVFLVWMYLAWTVVIFGAVVTAALDEFRHGAHRGDDKPLKNNKEKISKKALDKRTN